MTYFIIRSYSTRHVTLNSTHEFIHSIFLPGFFFVSAVEVSEVSGGTPSISESLLTSTPCWFSLSPCLHQRQTWRSFPYRHAQTEETSHWAPPVIWHTSTHSHRHALHAYTYQNVLYISIQSRDGIRCKTWGWKLSENLKQVIIKWADAKKIHPLLAHSQTHT